MTSPSLPKTMRAWQYTSTRGGLDKNLHLNTSAPLPKPKSDQHLIRVIAAALNPIDYKPAELTLVKAVAIPNPATPGIDFAGEIVTPAPSSDLKAGQIVYGAAGNTPLAGGAIAEYAVAKTTTVVPLTEGLKPAEGASIPVAGLTAYQSILHHAKSGDKVFINGGSGGTGVFGLQIAKAAGLHVTTTCSTGNVDFVKSLGADKVVDYRSEDVVEALKTIAQERKFDHVVDNIGSNEELIWRNQEYMKANGVYVIVGGGATTRSLVAGLKRKLWPGFLGGLKGKVVGFWPDPNTKDLAKIGEWMAEGKVKPIFDQRFPFEDAPKAIERLKTSRAKGKIIIDVGEEGSKMISA